MKLWTQKRHHGDDGDTSRQSSWKGTMLTVNAIEDVDKDDEAMETNGMGG